MAGNTLPPRRAADTGMLTVTEGGTYQFALSADLLGLGGGVTMTVIDASGATVFSLTVTGGQPPVTAVKYLAAGTYRVTYRHCSTQGLLIAPVLYGLSLLRLLAPTE